MIQDQQTRVPVRDYAAMLYRAMESDIDNFKKTFCTYRNFDFERQLQSEKDEYKKIRKSITLLLDEKESNKVAEDLKKSLERTASKLLNK